MSALILDAQVISLTASSQIRRLDAALDKFQLLAATSRRPSIPPEQSLQTNVSQDSASASRLKATVRALSTTSGSRPLLSRHRLRSLVLQLAHEQDLLGASQAGGDDADLAWIATGKATVQLYGLILNSLLEQTIPLSEAIWYWDDVLGSYANTMLYTVQTSPERFWKQAKDVYEDAKDKLRHNRGFRESAQEAQTSVQEGWREFYALVQNSIREKSLAQARTKILSPFSICRMQARKNQARIRRLRETNATGIGLIVDEGLSFQPIQDLEAKSPSPVLDRSQWQSTVAKSVSLLENVLRNATGDDASVPEFEENVFTAVEADPEIAAINDLSEGSMDPSQLAKRIIHIIDDHLPVQEQDYLLVSTKFGKPRRLIRYWIPGVILLLSGSTLLRIFANRKAEIVQWIRDFGSTVQDFWLNWVIEPTKKLIGTIRHDQDSEIAIQSKESLKADRESLERMVVDFAIEHPENGTTYSGAQIADIRVKVKEGDLTPVLKAYEREMQSPIKNAVMGDLVRTLLIQVQKTKVDVEVAIGGIDSLLKSQELLFGFVGIAPGVLISYYLFQWLGNTFGGRRGLRLKKQQGETVRVLRNIDRTLTTSTPTNNGMLSYKDHGLLLCEGHVLRQRAAQVLPGNVQREFLEDFNDLMDIRIGIDRQIKVLERIQWAYSRWLR
jgi:nuclear control of ATPase protein 2